MPLPVSALQPLAPDEVVQETAVACHQRFWSSTAMSNHVYEKIEVVGSSTTGIEDAVKNAVANVAQRRRNLRWLEVIETRCHLENDAIAHWQVTVRIGVAAE